MGITSSQVKAPESPAHDSSPSVQDDHEAASASGHGIEHSQQEINATQTFTSPSSSPVDTHHQVKHSPQMVSTSPEPSSPSGANGPTTNRQRDTTESHSRIQDSQRLPVVLNGNSHSPQSHKLTPNNYHTRHAMPSTSPVPTPISKNAPVRRRPEVGEKRSFDEGSAKHDVESAKGRTQIELDLGSTVNDVTSMQGKRRKKSKRDRSATDAPSNGEERPRKKRKNKMLARRSGLNLVPAGWMEGQARNNDLECPVPTVEERTAAPVDTSDEVVRSTYSAEPVDKEARPRKIKRSKRSPLSHLNIENAESTPTKISSSTREQFEDIKISSSDQEQASKVKKSRRQSRTVDNSTLSSGGKFTDQERDTVDGVFQQVLRSNGLTRGQLVANIQGVWGSTSDFPKLVEEALPHRSKASIRKFCKRAYHNFATGPWTEDEDAKLREAMRTREDDTLPDAARAKREREQWTKISELVGRRAEDCRDRWRDALSTKMVGPWSVEEEERLQSVVDASKNDINWTKVGLKFTRSARACREKYAALEKRRLQAKGAGNSRVPLVSIASTKTPSRSDRRKSTIKHFKIGDHYDNLIEIIESFPEPSKRFPHETTVWAIVAQNNPGSRFQLHTGVRRALYEQCLKDLSFSSERNDLTIAQIAAAMAREMEEKYGTNQLERSRKGHKSLNASAELVEDSSNDEA